MTYCPYCNSLLSKALNKSKICQIDSENHFFYWENEHKFYLTFDNKSIGVDPLGSYINFNAYNYKSKIIAIHDFDPNDCKAVLEKYLKLKAFL